LYDNLYGTLANQHTLALAAQNVTDGMPYPNMHLRSEEQELPREPGDSPDLVRYSRMLTSEKDSAQARIDAIRDKGIELEPL